MWMLSDLIHRKLFITVRWYRDTTKTGHKCVLVRTMMRPRNPHTMTANASYSFRSAVIPAVPPSIEQTKSKPKWRVRWDNRNTAWLRDTVRQTSREKSADAGRTCVRTGRWLPEDRRSAPAADFPRDVCLTVSRNHTVFLLSNTNI